MIIHTIDRGSNLQELLASLLGLAAQADDLFGRLTEIELSSPDLLSPDLSAAVGVLNGSAKDLLGALLDLYESRDGEAGEIADFVFVALQELRARERKFARDEATKDPLIWIAGCGRILRHLKRAFTAVEAAICRVEGLTPVLNLKRELQLALEVRAAYAKFRQDIESIRAACRPEEEDAGPALRSAATCIARLAGGDIFPRLRLGDRLYLRGLEERIASWMRSAGTDSDEAGRLWGDLHAFTKLLQAVNQRQELIEHDQAVLKRIGELAAQSQSLEAVRGSLLVLASRLIGRDEALDVLLAGDPDPGELLALVESLRQAAAGQHRREAPDGPLLSGEAQDGHGAGTPASA